MGRLAAITSAIVHAVRFGACALLCVLIAACGVSLPDPTVDAVVPARGWNGEDTVVTIAGKRFYPQIALDASSRGDADLDPAFEAWLVDPQDPGTRFALSGVSALGTQSLRGIVDAGLPPGLYDLLVVGPTGRSGRLVSAFTISDFRGDRLELEPAHKVREVNEWTSVELTLRDANGERVLDDISVAVTATLHGDPGPSGPELFFDVGGGWVEAQPIPGGLEGRLGADGSASFVFSAATPGTYTLTARALDSTVAVRTATADLHFEPTKAMRVRIELPAEDFTAVAGDPFDVLLRLVDLYGNPMPHAVADVALRNLCGGWVDLVRVRGEALLPVSIGRASDPACPFDALITDPISEVAGQTGTFRILPGSLAAFEVHVFNGPAVAGGELYALIDPVDAHGNRTSFDGSVTVRDTLGDVGPLPCMVPGGGGVCVVSPTIASQDARLEAMHASGAVGLSSPYRVLPEPQVGQIAVAAPAVAMAGQPFAVDIRYHDRFGNLLDAAEFPLDVTADDELDEAECDAVGHTIRGSVQVRCRTFTARPNATIGVQVGQSVSWSTAFRVNNGRLAVVQLTTPPKVTAGQGFPLELQGFDAWGNPYLRHDDARVALSDSTGTLTPGEATFGPDGRALVQAALTRAGSTVVHAFQDGTLLGTSSPLKVDAGTSQAFLVEPVEPWAWTSEPTAVRVEAIDSWGNRTPTDTVVTLASRTTDATSQQIAIVDGFGVGWFQWTEPATPDVLEATSGTGLIGESRPLNVVSDCGHDGPEAHLTLGGHAEGIACFDPSTGKATLAASLSGSLLRTGAWNRWLLDVEGEGTFESDQPNLLLDVHSMGVRRIRALAIRDDSCAHEVSSRIWVGPDDGTPVGPISLLPAQIVLADGNSTSTVLVSDVVDCSRDVAAGARIKVRTDLGKLHGVQSTGRGLELTLDSAAEGAFQLDIAGARDPGPVTVRAWVDSGAAMGRAELEILQDLARPVVLDQQPSGFTEAMLDEVRLVFSEPLRAEDVTPDHFGVYGPYAVTVHTVRLENDDTEVVLELEPPVDGTAGLWTVHASQDVRDLAGNRLGGQWTSHPLPYNGYFGLTPNGPTPVHCTSIVPEEKLFRPDGDDGSGPDSELVEVGVVTAVAPMWWRMTVSEAETGAWVLRTRRMPVSRFDKLVWDGRDQAGRVVENGRYHIEVAPVDVRGNTSSACEVGVEVANGAGGTW